MPVRPSTLKALTLTGALLLLAIPADARRSHHWGDDNSRWGEPRNKQKVRWRNYSSGPSSITSDWMQGRTSGSQRETKGLTTWEAAPKDEQQVDEEIEQAQIDYGTEDKRVARLMWKHAKNYFQARNYKKTKELIGEIRALTERDPNVTQHLPMDEIAKTERLANQGMLPLECRHDRQNYGGGVFGYDNLGSTGQSAPPTASAPASKAGKTANTPKKPGQSKAESLLASWPSALNNMPVPQQRHSNTSSSSALKLNQKVHQPIPIASLNQPYPGFNQSYSTGSPWTNNIAYYPKGLPPTIQFSSTAKQLRISRIHQLSAIRPYATPGYSSNNQFRSAPIPSAPIQQIPWSRFPGSSNPFGSPTPLGVPIGLNTPGFAWHTTPIGFRP